jgi:hypothetical protein
MCRLDFEEIEHEEVKKRREEEKGKEKRKSRDVLAKEISWPRHSVPWHVSGR